MREINKAICSCGGQVAEVEQTQEESTTYNCPSGCCDFTLKCDKCKTRFVIKLEAPEMD